MKYLFVILLSLVPQLIHAQTDKNHCQDGKQAHMKSSGVSSMLTDYDVVHYDLYIENINYGQQELTAHAGISVVAQLANVTDIELDLLGFTIDSITASGYSVTHSYNDTTIAIQLNPAITQGDSAEILIYYHGTPEQDASGWGGYYFSGNYAFNLGVGFAANPHNFGRAWFPCVDNFVSRSTYDFYITTVSTSKAFCNGTLQTAINNPNGTITWHWKINQTIPTYLASMAVAPYYTLQRNYNGIPVEWATTPTDTSNVLATFANLDTILESYINAYGPYPFDKVGYCLVPFNSGAMEHATSIHIGNAFVNGSQAYATLWAHELSHMWWGDKVTCESEGEMWLNEGFATYNEALYTQVINGPSAYTEWIRSNHRKVVQFAHTPAQDGSYLTMNAIPHDYTYGYHVYQKGADLVHTLRNYMGDSAFFNGCKAYMNNQAYSDASSEDLRDELTSGSGINMNRFFDDWIFTPGFPHFSIDSAIYVPGGLDHMFVYTRQQSLGNTHLYEMPIELNFSNGTIDTAVTVVIDSVTNMFHIPLYFMPTWTTIDRNEKVSDAISSNEKTITATGNVSFLETNASLNVQSLGSTNTIVRIQHHFVPPDPFIGSNPGIKLSDYHYWSTEGIYAQGFLSKAAFFYDGSTSSTTGYLDNTFITGNEDSLVILYRPGAGFNWEVVNSFIHNMGPSTTDKRGNFTVDTLMKGEYTIGMYDYTVGIHEHSNITGNYLQISPNPSNEVFTLKLKNLAEGEYDLFVNDMGGRTVYTRNRLSAGSEVIWNAEKNQSGIYQAVLFKEGKKITGVPLVLSK